MALKVTVTLIDAPGAILDPTAGRLVVVKPRPRVHVPLVFVLFVQATWSALGSLVHAYPNTVMAPRPTLEMTKEDVVVAMVLAL